MDLVIHTMPVIDMRAHFLFERAISVEVVALALPEAMECLNRRCTCATTRKRDLPRPLQVHPGQRYGQGVPRLLCDVDVRRCCAMAGPGMWHLSCLHDADCATGNCLSPACSAWDGPVRGRGPAAVAGVLRAEHWDLMILRVGAGRWGPRILRAAAEQPLLARLLGAGRRGLATHNGSVAAREELAHTSQRLARSGVGCAQVTCLGHAVHRCRGGTGANGGGLMPYRQA